jgi:hypothetical protein
VMLEQREEGTSIVVSSSLDRSEQQLRYGQPDEILKKYSEHARLISVKV